MMGEPIEIIGRLSESEGCWSLEVSEDDYRRLMGEEDYRETLAIRARFDRGHHAWSLSPSDLLKAAGVAKKWCRVRLAIEAEWLGD